MSRLDKQREKYLGGKNESMEEKMSRLDERKENFHRKKKK